jgi:diguanylate cyclase (GGDEF)-like protein
LDTAERRGKGGRPAGPTAGSSAHERLARAVLSVLDDLTRETEEPAFLQSTLVHVVAALEAAGGAVELDSGDGVLQSAAESNYDPPDPEAHRDLILEAFRTGRPRLAELAGGGWMAAAPLKGAQGVLGVLSLHDASEGCAAPTHTVLEVLSRQIGAGLESLRLNAALRTSAARLEVLHRITTLSADTDIPTAVAAFAREIGSLQPFDRLACGFVNDSGDYLEVTGHPAGGSWGFGPVHPVVGSGPGQVLLRGAAVFQRDLVHEHRFIEDLRLLEEGLRSYLLLPLVARGRTMGVLALGANGRDAFDELALIRLQPVADAAALALDNVRLLHKTRELSILDEVTPLYNFRFFHQILDRELKLVDRYRSMLSLIFLDLDRFKPINDQHGHLRGSRVLREVGFLLRAAVRETDYPVRYGGDEFVVILPQTDGAAAIGLGEKLRRLIEEHTFLQEEGIDARLGLSMGVATYPIEVTTKEALIRLADERMYQEKDSRPRGLR